MLTQLRQGATSWVAKILFSLLMALLVLSFAAWGIGDVFRIRPQTWVAKVGDVEIDREAVTSSFRREVQRLQQMFGRTIDNEQARKLGLLDATVKQLVGGTLLDLEARKLGMDISDDAIIQEVHGNPAFRNALGQFDNFQFEAMLRNNGFTPRSFQQTIKRDMLRNHLQTAVQSSGAVPGEIADRVYRHQMERRAVELLVFPNAAQGEVGDPDEAALAQFHKDNAERFTAPELRGITVVTLTAEDLAKKTAISEAELKEEYQNRLRDFTREERRDLEQMVVPEEATAKAAHERLAKGEDFATVAKEVANLSPADIVFDNVARREMQRDLPGPLAAAVFALAQGAVSEPIQTAFGWHVVKVKAVRPGGTDSFEQVREQLKTAIGLQRAGDEATKLSRKLDDELAGGGTLEEAAAKFDLPIFKAAAIDLAGHDADGKPVAGLPDIPELARTAFASQPGPDLRLNETEKGGYFVVRVDGITPPELRPLAAIRPQVVEAWKEDRRAQASRAKATQALEKLNAGAKLIDVGFELGGVLKASEPILRSGDGAGPELSRSLITAVFALEPGKTTVGATGGNDGHVLVRVTEVKPAEADQAAVTRLQKTLADGMGLDVLTQFSQALEKLYPVKIDQKALETLF
jgi:peptidyl-prolyl cis-trans isomerase D